MYEEALPDIEELLNKYDLNPPTEKSFPKRRIVHITDRPKRYIK